MKRIFLLKQHIGAPDTAAVAVGDEVKVGTLLAYPEKLGANIFSSVEGKVTEVSDSQIVVDGEEKEEDFVKIQAENPLDCVKAAGIVGMGGAGFPTNVKLNIDLKGGYLLVNAAECEPVLAHNMLQIMQQPEKTLRGADYCAKMVNASKVIIAIKAKHKEEIEKLKQFLPKFPSFSLHLLPDLYPMGEERAVVREALGKLLPPTALPSEADAVVINVETVLRVAEAIEDHRPVITKNLTVAGKLKGEKKVHVFMDVPIGTTVGELIEKAGGIDGDYGEIVMGGPFTGHAVSLDTPITKTSGGIIVTEPFEDFNGAKIGLLLCACGGNVERMEDLAKKYNAEVVSYQACKQAQDVKGTLKCENPGNCPGQAQKCLNFKKDGCEYILIGNCSDCTNTVMGSAPKLGLKVIHQTDNIFKTMGMEPMRYLTKSKKVEEEPEVSAEAQAQPETSAEAKDYEYLTVLSDGDIMISIESGSDIHISIE